MAKESSIVGVMLGQASEVRNFIIGYFDSLDVVESD